MLKALKRFLILLVIFILGVAGTVFLMNNETTDDRSDMNNPTLPEVLVDFNGTLANRMYGYRQPMEADFVRDSVTPLDTTKKLTIAINPYDEKVKSLSYEVRTSDGTKIVENRKIKNLDSSGSDGYLRAQIEINSGLLMNQEYSMQLTVDTNDHSFDLSIRKHFIDCRFFYIQDLATDREDCLIVTVTRCLC